jgi:hypothetical protein
VIDAAMIEHLAALGILVNPNGPVEQRMACPRCAKSRRDMAFGVDIESGTYHCFRCNWAGRAGGNRIGAARPIMRIEDPTVAQRKRERLRRTWHESVPLSHPKATPVRAYLESRGLDQVLDEPQTVLRAHPGLTYWDGAQELGRYPAMLALFANTSGRPITIHVTYVRCDGGAKAGVPSPKKILGVPVRGATCGGAIHLYEPLDGRLGVAEGIESALSLHLIHRLPVWASFCADNLARMYLPPNIRELYIGVDMDESGKGEVVSRALAARVSERSPRTKIWFVKPRVERPADLNDELRRCRATRMANAATQMQTL